MRLLPDAGVGRQVQEKECDCTILILSAKNKVLVSVKGLTPIFAGPVESSEKLQCAKHTRILFF